MRLLPGIRMVHDMVPSPVRLVRFRLRRVLLVATSGVIALPLVAGAQGDSLPVVVPSAAAQYAGREVIVRGRVVQVSTSRTGTTFINFDKPFPNHTFNAVIFGRDAKGFTAPDQWEGKTVDVRGTVQIYQGKPEIILRSPDQVRVVGEKPW